MNQEELYGWASTGEAHLGTLSQATADRVLDLLAPGSTLRASRLMTGSFSNITHLVEATRKSGEHMRLVVRRYSGAFELPPHQKARLEYDTLLLLKANEVLAPEPLFIDENGTVLGAPGIVTSFLEGDQVISPSSMESWAVGLAESLARIHSIHCGETEMAFLLDSNSTAVSLLDSEGIPDNLASHPDGAAVWDALQSLKRSIVWDSPRLVHTDFWTGNVLWRQDELSGIVDWEEAAFGDPAMDIGFCRMEMYALGMFDAADHLLKTYEAATGRRLENLELWELLATDRIMPDPAKWLKYWRTLGDTWSTPDSVRRNFRRFVADALRRVEN